MKKIALIIGNSKYPNNELPNSINDAISIDENFTELGIKTLLYTDLTKVEFANAIKKYEEELENYEVGIFFFAGHGMQIEGENYLCAIDTNFEGEIDVKYSSIALNHILDILKKSPVYTKILILDACRDNPYEKSFRSAYNKGLAPIYAPLGTIIAFATSPGETASDGGDGNGAFTKAFLEHLGQNDIKIEELFKRVRNTLFAITNSKQLSWEHTSLMGDFYFSTSHLTGEYDTRYDENSFSDENFDISEGKEILSIIESLKSCNWHSQNPAMKLISNNVLKNSNKNEIFVLGRNIYQTADGGAFKGVDYIQNLRSNLSLFSDEVSFHLLNGIIFEIYFNSEGKLREYFKIGFIDDVIPLLKGEKYKASALFLKEKLDSFDFRVIYDVTGKQNFIFELIAEYMPKTASYRIKEIRKESKNILYNEEGSEEYKISENEVCRTRENIQKRVAYSIGAPISGIQCIFTGLPDDIDQIDFPIPSEHKLLNYQMR